MSLLQWKNFWRRKSVPQRRPYHRYRLGCEPLENRRMLALLGITPTFPIIAYDSNGVAAYDAAADTFDVNATPLTFKASIPAPPRTITNPRDVEIHILVDDAGALIGGTAGDDLKVEGNVDLDGNPLTTADNLSGVLLTEIVFNYPGLGVLLLNAINSRDYPLMQGIFLMFVIAVLVANLAVDIIYVMLDPRAR